MIEDRNIQIVTKSAPGRMTYRALGLEDVRKMGLMDHMSDRDVQDLDVVTKVLPFRVSHYVVTQLIDWSRVPDDPIYRLTFPSREMLKGEDFERLSNLVHRKADHKTIRSCVHAIRTRHNPHPGGQQEYNTPRLDGKRLEGVQHKYDETVLYFPRQGQTCHSYCTFCFRWPQFTMERTLRFGTTKPFLLVRYLQENPGVTDVLFTGGDPMIMSTEILKQYLDPLLAADLPSLQTIRIGTRALTFWPYRFLTDPDSDALLRLVERIVKSGKHLALMAHINHPRELMPQAAREAIRRIRSTGAQIRAQSPIVRHINDHPKTWSRLWSLQVKMGLVPYYMFIPRNTSVQNYFTLPLVQAWKIYRNAYRTVSGLARTVRGPIMSGHPGKIQILGTARINGEKILLVTFIQARNPDWVGRPFAARYDEEAMWLNDLQPAFGKEKFFYERELEAWEFAAASGAKACRVDRGEWWM